MIEYKVADRAKVNDDFSNMLRETAHFFADQGIQMTTQQGFEEILAEQNLFNEYKSHLCEGLDAEQSAHMDQLMENSRLGILKESSVAGVQQIAGLSMPTLRKMWAKISLKHAMPTQVVATPRFAISYTKAYLMDSEGNKYLGIQKVKSRFYSMLEAFYQPYTAYSPIKFVEDAFDRKPAYKLTLRNEATFNQPQMPGVGLTQQNVLPINSIKEYTML